MYWTELAPIDVVEFALAVLGGDLLKAVGRCLHSVEFISYNG